MRANTARRKVSAGLMALVASTACAATTPTRYKALAEDWHRSEAAAAPHMAGAPDRLFAGALFLERRELVRQVLRRNPTVRAARYAWRAALARYPQVTALDDPMVGAGLAPRSIGSNRVDDAPRFDVSQKFPFPGKLRLRGEAALGEADAASHDHAAVRLRLATMASLLYDDYHLVSRSLEITARHVSLLEEFKRIATTRYEAGMGAQQDPIQAEVELTHALHRQIVLGTAHRVTTEQINALLHRPTHGDLPPTRAGDLVQSAPGDGPDQLITLALEHRPELAAAEARVGAEQARLELAWREYFPDFSLVGAYNGVMQPSRKPRHGSNGHAVSGSQSGTTCAWPFEAEPTGWPRPGSCFGCSAIALCPRRAIKSMPRAPVSKQAATAS